MISLLLVKHVVLTTAKVQINNGSGAVGVCKLLQLLIGLVSNGQWLHTEENLLTQTVNIILQSMTVEDEWGHPSGSIHSQGISSYKTFASQMKTHTLAHTPVTFRYWLHDPNLNWSQDGHIMLITSLSLCRMIPMRHLNEVLGAF